MDGDAEHRARRERDRAELARRAQEHRDEAAGRTPGVLDALDRLSDRVEALGDLAGEVGALREGLAAAYAAADPEEDAPQPRRRDHLRLIRNDDLEAG